MSIGIKNFENEDRKVIETLGNYSILEYTKDKSVAPSNAITEYYMSEMGVRKRQLVVDLDGRNSLITQAGAMQWIMGDINATTGIKGVGDFFGKALKGAVTKESTIKPEYVGNGKIFLEPTYKYIILQDVADWGPMGVSIEDGMFLAADGTVKQKLAARTNFSSAVAGNEGLFNLSLSGSGIFALESNVPMSELMIVELNDDVVKLDGSFAVCWSTSLNFTVERSSKSLIGSAVNGEGLVNVYRGTGKILLAPVTPTSSLFAATH